MLTKIFQIPLCYLMDRYLLKIEITNFDHVKCEIVAGVNLSQVVLCCNDLVRGGCNEG